MVSHDDIVSPKYIFRVCIPNEGTLYIIHRLYAGLTRMKLMAMMMRDDRRSVHWIDRLLDEFSRQLRVLLPPQIFRLKYDWQPTKTTVSTTPRAFKPRTTYTDSIQLCPWRFSTSRVQMHFRWCIIRTRHLVHGSDGGLEDVVEGFVFGHGESGNVRHNRNINHGALVYWKFSSEASDNKPLVLMRKLYQYASAIWQHYSVLQSFEVVY